MNTDNMSDLNNEKQEKSKAKSIIFIFIILSIILIATGVYLLYIGNPKKILATAIDAATSNVKKIITTNEATSIGNNFTVSSNVSFSLESEYLNQMATTNPTLVPYSKLLTNINNTQNNLIFAQDKENKKMLLDWNSTLNNQELISTKYLIENSTEYYYVKGFLDTYVNNGTSNYFESLEDNTTTPENLIYLYDFIIASLKENIPEEYFEKHQEQTTFDGKDVKLTKSSIKLDNERLKTIASAILKDLKQDSKANKILMSINEDFKSAKIKDSARLLDENHSITLNIYTSNFTYQIKKYEFIYSKNTEETKITYEVNKTDSNAYIIKNSRALYKLKINKSNNKYKIIVEDATSGKELGEITSSKSSKKTTIIASVKDKDNEISINYDLKLSNIKAKKSYTSDASLNIKIVSNNIKILNGTIRANNIIENKVAISEDVSTSILASSITKEQQVLLQQRLSNITTQLMN